MLRTGKLLGQRWLTASANRRTLASLRTAEFSVYWMLHLGQYLGRSMPKTTKTYLPALVGSAVVRVVLGNVGVDAAQGQLLVLSRRHGLYDQLSVRVGWLRVVVRPVLSLHHTLNLTNRNLPICHTIFYCCVYLYVVNDTDHWAKSGFCLIARSRPRQIYS